MWEEELSRYRAKESELELLRLCLGLVFDYFLETKDILLQLPLSELG
jgi:hypothetical protein